MIIPGIIISILTFPGVIVHEAAHMLFCKLRKVPVYDVEFFRFSLSSVGYVIHDEPKDFTSLFLISIGPFIVNSLLTIVICFPATAPWLFEDVNFITLFLLWLGISMGMNAFPSNQDAANIWRRAKIEIRRLNPLAIISLPVILLIYLSNLLKVLWFDAIYGLVIGVILPGLILKSLM